LREIGGRIDRLRFFVMDDRAYTGKKGFEIRKTEHFGIQRKIVANMTSDSWESIPHVSGIYEPDVTNFWDFFQTVKKTPAWDGITLNTVMLAILTQGLLACPAMNSHIAFNRRFVNGTIETYKDVNISMPMLLPTGEMMTINIHNCERKSLRQLNDYILDVRRRMENTNLTEAMFSVAMDNTMRLVKEGAFLTIAGRLLGAAIGRGKIKRLPLRERIAYNKIPETERLTKEDIEQGTVLVSNFGSVYKNSYVMPTLLEIIPPQVLVIGLGTFGDRPGVVTNENGAQSVAVRKYLPINISFDHRALDFGELVPFFKRLDDIFENPQQLLKLL
jgi:pyruvate dehydrogenase E2 component (dihydrolipoamide acetyltransferase)